jgi:hypothetical protein
MPRSSEAFPKVADCLGQLFRYERHFCGDSLRTRDSGPRKRRISQGAAVKHSLPRAIVEFLSFSDESGDSVSRLRGGSPAQWECCLAWMHDMGLALYFLKIIKDRNAEDLVPDSVLQLLNGDFSANQCRVTHMEQQFVLLNRKFGEAGVTYAAVKGLTLVPEFCRDASLRHQSDFDYLVDEGSLPQARHVLEGMGYFLHKESSQEQIFVMPSAGQPSRGHEQYKAEAPHSVELHRTVSQFRGLSLVEPCFIENTTSRELRGSVYQTLSQEDAFVLQGLHCFHHILDGWAKLSWLYEIAYFIEKRGADHLLWQKVSRKFGNDPLLREAVALAVELAGSFFKAPVPRPIKQWIDDLRPAVRLWIEHYARSWAFGKNRVGQFGDQGLLPTSKLVLFLHQQYATDARTWRRDVALGRLLPLERLTRIARTITTKPLSVLRPQLRKRERVFRRIAFHLGAGIRYLWEVPRWRRLVKRSAG